MEGRKMTEGRKEALKREGKTGGLRDLGTQMEEMNGGKMENDGIMTEGLK
jgi:hypothetical protein